MEREPVSVDGNDEGARRGDDGEGATELEVVVVFLGATESCER